MAIQHRNPASFASLLETVKAKALVFNNQFSYVSVPKRLNTYLVPVYENSELVAIRVRFYRTDILEFHRDGTVKVFDDSSTMTTKRRINEYLPRGSVYSKKGTLYYSNSGETRPCPVELRA